MNSTPHPKGGREPLTASGTAAEEPLDPAVRAALLEVFSVEIPAGAPFRWVQSATEAARRRRVRTARIAAAAAAVAFASPVALAFAAAGHSAVLLTVALAQAAGAGAAQFGAVTSSKTWISPALSLSFLAGALAVGMSAARLARTSR